MSIKLTHIIAILSIGLCVQSTFGMDVPAPTREKGLLDVPKDVHKQPMQENLGAQDRENYRNAMGNIPLRSALGRPAGTLPVAILSCPTLSEVNAGLTKLTEGFQGIKIFTDSKGRNWDVGGHVQSIATVTERPMVSLSFVQVSPTGMQCNYIPDQNTPSLRLNRYIPTRPNPQPNLDSGNCRAAEPNLRHMFVGVVAGAVTSFEHSSLPDGFKVECNQVMLPPPAPPAPPVPPEHEAGGQ